MIRRLIEWACPDAALSRFANVPGYHCMLCAFGPGVSGFFAEPSDGVWCEL